MSEFGFLVNNSAGNPILDTTYPILHFIQKTTVTASLDSSSGVYYYDYTPVSDADHMPLIAARCDQSDLYICCTGNPILLTGSGNQSYQTNGKYRIAVGKGTLVTRTIQLTIYEFARLSNSHKMSTGEFGLETYSANGDLLWSSKIPSANVISWIAIDKTQAPYGGGNILGYSTIGTISDYSSSRVYASAIGSYLLAGCYDLGETVTTKFLVPGVRFDGANIIGAGVRVGSTGPFHGGFYYSDWALTSIIFDVTDL